MNSTGNIQRALTKGPGSASAAALWTVRAGQAANAVRAAAALLKTAETLKEPGNLYLLVGLSPLLLAHSACASEAEGAISLGDEGQEASVFVQVAAQTHVDRLFGLRLVDAALSGAFDRRWELLGDKILHGMEGFGFRDGEPPAWNRGAAPGAAPERGMWLMQQRFDYLLGPFFQQGGPNRQGRDRARAEVMGRPPGVVGSDADKVPPTPTERAAIEAHLANLPTGGQGRRPHSQLMREQKVETMMRRGFPFRHDGVEGLMFLAASLRAADLKAALDLFNSRDKLAEHVQGKAPGWFFCPNSAEVLFGAAVEALAIPATAEVLQHGPDLMDYTVSVDDMNYMEAFVFGGGALRPPPLREEVRPEIRALFRDMHMALAADATQLENLESLLDTFHETSRRINRLVGTYITKG